MRITKWSSSIMIVMLMISSLGVSAAATEVPAAVETASAEQAQIAEAEAPATEKSSPVKAEEEPGEDYLTITLYGGDYGYFGSPSVVSREYHPHKGDPFNPDAQPTAVSDRYLFAGWYSGIQGRGDRYTEETIIDEEMDGKNIYANWLPNASVIPVMELDNVYALDVPSEGVLFAFTPSATTTYEMYTTENDPYESIANIRLLNDKLITIEESRSMDRDFNAIISTELTAGTTYYIEFSEVFGTLTAFNAVISRADTVPVTFHANLSKYGEAYFDKDPDITEKTIDIRKGTHLEHYASSGLEVDRDSDFFFIGWSLDPDAVVGDDEILADGPADVYAVYGQIKRVILDANGGSFPSLGTDVTQYTYRYYPGTIFSPRHDPESGDPDLLFAGWADSADASEPNIPENVLYDDICEKLYAVYGEKLTVTFDANGGYLFANPEIKTFRLTYAKGHIFEATHVEHEMPNMEFTGWMDQNGVFIEHTETDHPEYHYNEDTYLTAMWNKRVFVDANGGCFHFDPDLTQVVVSFPTSDAFSNQVIIEQHGEPIGTDDLQYLAGWATTPDASEPDVVEGGTDVTGLTKIYAVWKEDSYYLAQGADQSWEKGSSEGLTFTVKRTGDDAMTFSCFRDVKVDGSSVEYPLSKIAEGSLILTLEPEYLESLSVGEHEVRFEFTENAAVETTFTVTEPSVPDEDPDTDPDKDPDKDKDDPKGSGNKSSGSDPGKKGSGSKSGGSSAKRSKAAKTADTANAFLWIAIIGASFLGIAHAKRR